MSDPRTDLPNPKAANFNQRIRETLMTYLGRQGNPLDRGLTLRDLLENGLVKIRDGFTLKPGQSGTLPLEPIPADGEADLTPPPTPTGFAVSAAITHVFIEHDAPLYRQGHGHLRTRVYGKIVQAGDPLPTFADATEITQFSGTVHAHPSNPATTWHLWIKWESVDGVLSTNPAGGTNGLSTTTGQDVALLLDALAGQITESELYQTLNDRINLIDGPSTLANSVAQRLAAEAEARALAITAEATTRAAEVAAETAARVSADAAETQARIDAVAAETAARNDKIAIESHQRLAQVQSTGEAALNAIIAANNERIDRLTDVASARQELKTDFDAGILAEATARLALTAVVNQNVADILSEQTARSTADSALASSITTLTSQVNNNTAAIQSEATTRANADAVEATQRNLLAAQFRGDYTGNDINQVTSGLLYQERIARATQDNALAQQITLLSAGAGEQFDWKKIWYFDDGAESWSGNGTPTVNQGWLRPANQDSGAYVESPTGIGSDGNKYGQVRLRIRKVGSPTFAGFLWWRAAADTTWDTARRVALTAPTFDANGIGLITVSPAWTVIIDRIRVDLSSAQTATDYLEIDWVAVGRPSPGASSAQLLEEQEARATADAAEATERKTLSSTLIGQENPDGVTLSGLTSGLLFEERQARATQDTAIATSVTSLQTTVTNNYTTLSSAITDEATARSTADTSEANARKSLSATLTGLEDPTGKTLADLTSGLVFDEKAARVTADSALSQSITGLNATVGDLSADLLTVQQTVADLDSATASSVTTLVAADRRNKKTLDELAEAALRDAIAVNNERTTRQETLAFAQESLSIKIEEGLLAESQARQLLSATVNENTASILAEQMARATADESISTSLTALIAQTGSDAQAAILAEQTARTAQDSALANSIASLTATVNDNTAAIVAEQTTRAGADNALASSITALTATVEGNLVSINAAILAEQTARADADSAEANAREALAARVTTAEGGISTNAAAIVSEQTARVNADNALVSSISALTATVENNQTSNSASLLAEQTARADADSALSTSITNLSAVANAKNKTYSQAAAPTSGMTKGDLWFDSDDNNKAYRYSGTGWVATDDTRIAANIAAITAEQTARANADSTLASDISTVSASVATKNKTYYQAAAPTSGMTAGDLWFDSNDANKAYRYSGSAWVATSDTRIAANASAIQTESTARANADSALATQITTLQSTVDTNNTTLTAAVQTEASTRATETGNLFAKYTVKIDVAGHVSGYGLASTANNATPTSQFGVRANQFFVAPPSVSQATAPTTGLYKGYVWVDTSVTPNVTKYYTGSAWGTTPQALPFVIQTSATTINGESVPAGVYIDDAYIKNGTITNAKIGDAAIDNAKIANLSASKLTAGSIAVGQYIQSAGYVAGSSGWRINGDGNAELSNATVRGTVYATNGQFWGTLLGGAASSYSSGLGFYAGGGTASDGANYRWRVGSPTGARIQWNGSAVEVYNGSNQLTISSGGISASNVSGLGALATQNNVSTSQVTGLGTLATQNSISTSQVTGLGTLATQNSVSTSQVTGLGSLATQSSVNWNTQITNIPSFGNFAYLNSITSANISTYIAGAAIGTAYIANGAITNALIANAAVGEAQIANAAITQAKIASAAIGSAQIADAAITTAKIGSAQIDTAQLAGNAVTVSNQASGTAQSVSTTLSIPAYTTMAITAVGSIGSFISETSIAQNWSVPLISVSIGGVGISDAHQYRIYASGETWTDYSIYATSISYGRSVTNATASPVSVTITVTGDVDSVGASKSITAFGYKR